MAAFAAALAPKLQLTPFAIRWQMYLPELMQYSHALLYAGGAWTISPFSRPVADEARDLAAAPDLSGL